MPEAKERDAYLDELMAELRQDRPYIEEPDERQVDVGGLCFLTPERVCGASCTAFKDPDGATARERCSLLAGMHTGLSLLAELVQLGQRRARPVAAPACQPPDPLAQHRRPA